MLKDNLIGKTRALDVGSGSGYLTVCMSLMMNGGFTYGIENPTNLSKNAVLNIKKNHSELFEDGRTVMMQPGNIDQTLETVAPFDAVYLGKETDEIPMKYMRLLNNRGRMVIIIIDFSHHIYKKVMPIGDYKRGKFMIFDKTDTG